MSAEENMKRARNAVESLPNLYPDFAVRLNPDQQLWAQGHANEAQVVTTSAGAGDCANVMTHFFRHSLNPQTVADLAPVREQDAENDRKRAFAGMLFNVGAAYNLVSHGIDPKMIKPSKNALDQLALRLTSADSSSVIFFETVTLPNVILKPGENYRSTPNDVYLRVWIFAQPHEKNRTDELNCVPLDVAIKLNVCHKHLKQQHMLGNKSKDSLFDSTVSRNFNQDSVSSVHEWRRIVECSVPEVSETNVSADSTDLKIYHPEILLNPRSPPFQIAKDPGTDTATLHEGVCSRRQKILKCASRISNYIVEGKNMFCPVDPTTFSKLPQNIIRGTGQASVAVSEHVTPNRQHENYPSILIATQLTMKLKMSSKNEMHLKRLIKKFKTYTRIDSKRTYFKQSVMFTKDDHWLLLRPGVEVDKRKCLKKSEGGSQRKLLDCMVNSDLILRESSSLNTTNCPFKFNLCESYDDFLRNVKSWSGDHQHDVPILLVEMHKGRMITLRKLDESKKKTLKGFGVCALVPDHSTFLHREALTLKNGLLDILSNSNFYPEAFHMQDTLQDGKSKQTILREYEEARLNAVEPPKDPRYAKLTDDAEEVTFAMHFAVGKKMSRQDLQKRDDALVKFCLEQSETKRKHCTKMEKLPVFFQNISKRVLPVLDAEKFYCFRSKLQNKYRKTSQNLYMDQCRMDNSNLSEGPDQSRVEVQATTVARKEFEEVKRAHGAKFAMEKSGEIFKRLVVNARQPNFHLENILIPWMKKNFVEDETGDMVCKATTMFPNWKKKDPDYYVEDVLESGVQQVLCYSNCVYKNHRQCHLIRTNWLTALHIMESNEILKQGSPCSHVAFIGDHGVGKSFKTKAVRSMIGKQHFQQEANQSEKAGQGVSRDTREGNMVCNDEFVMNMDEKRLAIFKSSIWEGILSHKRTKTRIGEDGGQEYAEDNITNRVNTAWVICLNQLPETTTADKKAWNNRFIFIFGDDKEDYIFDEINSDGLLFGHRAPNVDDESTRLHTKNAYERNVAKDTQERWNNVTMRMCLVEYFLASIGAQVNDLVAHHFLKTVTQYLSTQGVHRKQKNSRSSANIVKMCRAKTVETACMILFDVQKVPLTLNNLYKIVPLLCTTMRTAAKVYFYASEGDLGINYKLKKMDALFRTLMHHDITENEKNAISAYEEEHQQDPDYHSYIVRAFEVTRKADPSKPAKTLRSRWQTEMCLQGISKQHDLDADWTKLSELECAWGDYKCLKKTEDMNFPGVNADGDLVQSAQSDVDSDFDSEDEDMLPRQGPEFVFPSVKNAEMRKHLPYIRKRTAREKTDLRNRKVMHVEEMMVNNQRMFVYKFSWAMFLNLLVDKKLVTKMKQLVLEKNNNKVIDHHNCDMPEDDIATLFEKVAVERPTIIEKAIKYTLSDRFGASDMSQTMLRKRRSQYLAQNSQEDTGIESQVEEGSSGDVSELLKFAKSRFRCRHEGVRDLQCEDVSKDKAYSVFQLVTPYTWLNGKTLDHASTKTIIIEDDPRREKTELDSGGMHSVNGMGSFGDAKTVAKLYLEANNCKLLNRNIDDEMYFRHFLECTSENGLFDFPEYQLSKAQLTETYKDKYNNKQKKKLIMKYKRKIFEKKWIRQFPPSCLARFKIPVSEFAGHTPHLDIVEVIKASRHKRKRVNEGNASNDDGFSDIDLDSEDSDEEDAQQSQDSVLSSAPAVDLNINDSEQEESEAESDDSENSEESEAEEEQEEEEESDSDDADASEIEYEQGSSYMPVRVKKKRRAKKSKYFEDEASCADDSEEDEQSSGEEAEEQRRLNNVMVKGSDESDSDMEGGLFAGKAAADRIMDERDERQRAQQKRKRREFDSEKIQEFTAKRRRRSVHEEEQLELD